MIDLYRWFISPFNEEYVGNAKIDDYTPAHLAAMVANNPGGALNAPITATANLHAAFGGTISDETVKLGLQKAAVQAKEDFRSALANETSKLHGAVLARYGRRSPIVLEIFPHGLDAINDAPDNALEEALQSLVTALAARTADLGAAPHALAVDLRDQWASLYGGTATAKANKGSTAAARRAAGLALRRQLFKNLLQLAGLFPEQPEKAALYCPQHLLEEAPSAPPPNPPEG